MTTTPDETNDDEGLGDRQGEGMNQSHGIEPTNPEPQARPDGTMDDE